MFAKVFEQIFTSSIARDHLVRHVFMDLLVLADQDGNVDMTADAISRVTNVPEDMIASALNELTAPDKSSRTPDHDGRRLILLDDHRDWGWRIVNYATYRKLQSEEARREYFREAQKRHRQKVSNTNERLSASVSASASVVSSLKESARENFKPERGTRIPHNFAVTEEHRIWAKEKGFCSPDSVIAQFCDYWKAKAGKDAVKLDWDATFRNWIRNSENFAPREGKRNGKESIFDAIRNSRTKPDFGRRPVPTDDSVEP